MGGNIVITKRTLERKLRKVLRLRAKVKEVELTLREAEEEYAEAILQRRQMVKQR